MRIDDLIERHRAWWKLENEKPLLNIVYRERFPWMWLQSDHLHGMELFLKDTRALRRRSSLHLAKILPRVRDAL